MEYVFNETIQEQPISWLVGLRWYAVVEADAKTQAQRFAQQRGALSWVLSGQSMRSVGLSRQRVARKEEITYVAAAAFFAQIYAQQTVAAIIKLPNGQYWFVAAHKGQVIVRGDHCFAQLEQAQEFMRSVLADYPQMSDLNEHAPYMQWAFLFHNLAQLQSFIERARLQPSRKRLRPWVFWVFLLMCFFGGYYLWLWRGAKASVAAPLEILVQEQEEIVWPLVSAEKMLAPVLLHLYRLPTHSLGWGLTHAECNYSLAQQAWLCQAEYERLEQRVDTEEFLKQQQWEGLAQAKSLDSLQIDFPSLPVPLEGWDAPTTPTLFQLLSQLQSIQPAFSALHYRHQQDALRQWQNRTPIRLQGPLRSVPLVFELNVHVLWYRVELWVHSYKEPDLTNSQFEVLLKGAMDDAQIH